MTGYKRRFKRTGRRRHKVKKVKKKPAPTKLDLLVKSTRKRKPILVAVPTQKLYICKAEGKRFAFLRAARLIPMGVVQSVKSKRGEKRALLYPFDNIEHVKIARLVCKPKKRRR